METLELTNTAMKTQSSVNGINSTLERIKKGISGKKEQWTLYTLTLVLLES